MLDEASANVPRISPEDAKNLAARPRFCSLTCASRRKPCRGLVEFRANPSFGHAGQGIRSRQDRRRLLRLGRALGAGRRPWGYDKVLSLGGFKGWVDAGGEAEKG